MNNIAANNADKEYLMGRSSSEYKRLQSQAKFLEPITLRVMQQAGLKKGMNCLDVGCGTGDVMRLMGDIVTTSGSATGIDIDKNIGEEALSVLKALNNSNYSFHHFDITQNDLESKKYDFVFARLLLIHMTDPVGIIKKLFNAVKPGGTLLIQDNDFATLKASKKLRHLTDYVMKLVSDVYLQTGKDPEAGTNLSRYYIEAGIGRPDGTDASSVIFPIAEAAMQMKAGVHSMKPAIFKSGLASPERLDQLFEELGNAANEKNEFVLWFMHNGAWKKK